MLTLIDAMAERYGMLPTDILAKATTHDLVVFDVAATYRQYLSDKHNKKVTPNTANSNDLQQMWDRVKTNDSKNR